MMREEQIDVLKKVNKFLMSIMVNHPDYDAVEVYALNSEVCSCIKELREIDNKVKKTLL